MGPMASQITSLTIVYSTVYPGADQRKHQSSSSLAFVRGIHRRTVNSAHKWPVTQNSFHLMTSSWSRKNVKNNRNVLDCYKPFISIGPDVIHLWFVGAFNICNSANII